MPKADLCRELVWGRRFSTERSTWSLALWISRPRQHSGFVESDQRPLWKNYWIKEHPSRLCAHERDDLRSSATFHRTVAGDAPPSLLSSTHHTQHTQHTHTTHTTQTQHTTHTLHTRIPMYMLYSGHSLLLNICILYLHILLWSEILFSTCLNVDSGFHYNVLMLNRFLLLLPCVCFFFLLMFAQHFVTKNNVLNKYMFHSLAFYFLVVVFRNITIDCMALKKNKFHVLSLLSHFRKNEGSSLAYPF